MQTCILSSLLLLSLLPMENREHHFLPTRGQSLHLGFGFYPTAPSQEPHPINDLFFLYLNTLNAVLSITFCVCMYSNKTLFTKASGQLDLANGPEFAKVCFMWSWSDQVYFKTHYRFLKWKWTITIMPFKIGIVREILYEIADNMQLQII